MSIMIWWAIPGSWRTVLWELETSLKSLIASISGSMLLQIYCVKYPDFWVQNPVFNFHVINTAWYIILQIKNIPLLSWLVVTFVVGLVEIWSSLFLPYLMFQKRGVVILQCLCPALSCVVNNSYILSSLFLLHVFLLALDLLSVWSTYQQQLGLHN